MELKVTHQSTRCDQENPSKLPAIYQELPEMRSMLTDANSTSLIITQANKNKVYFLKIW